MKDIDRENNNLLDAHLWTEHEGLCSLCNELWLEYFKHDQLNKTGGKVKALAEPKDMLRVVLINLYVAWKEDEERAVGLAMSPNEYRPTSRYSKLHINAKIINIVHKLEKKQLIDCHIGSENSKRTTRIRATSVLMGDFKGLHINPFTDIQPRFINSELVVLQKKLEDGSKQLLEYKDTDEIKRMRAELVSYNNLLHHTHIDIPTLKKPYVIHKGKLVKVSHLNKLVKRIFYRGSFEYGGRLHGGFWQSISSKMRSQIYVNGGATVEADYSGLHISLLYGLKGVQPPDDPYTLAYSLKGFDKREQRQVVKGLVLKAINAKTQLSAFKSFKYRAVDGTKEKDLEEEDLQEILNAFCDEHPLLKGDIGADRGVSLMKLDAEIAMNVVNHFTEQGLPVLSVHDSFIIHCEKSIELKEVMDKAVSDAVGYKVNIKQEHLGLDEAGKIRDEDPESNVSFANLTKSHAITNEYKKRLQEHEEWRLSGINCLKGYLDGALMQPDLYSYKSWVAECEEEAYKLN
tara:strand:- start:180 stop:1727 length:1548 start_codon:yes stop_codon:yes gene_type:complete